MRATLTLLLLLAPACVASAGYLPATPAVIEIPIPPPTQPTYPTGEVAFLNVAGEPLNLTVKSYVRGPEDNGLRLRFAFAALGDGSPAALAVGVRETGFTVQLNTDNPPGLWDLSSAINSLPDLRSSYTSDSADPLIATLPPTDLVLAGGIGRGGITQDVFFELTSRSDPTGPWLFSERFLFARETTADQLAASMNLFTDLSRVEAGVVEDRLVLSTLDTGSRAFLDMRIVIEAGGRYEPKTFTDAFGTDWVFVQGRDAVIPEAATIASVVAALLAGIPARRLRF